VLSRPPPRLRDVAFLFASPPPMTTESPAEKPSRSGRSVLRFGLVAVLLFGFLLAIKMMGSAIKLMGEGTAEGLFSGVDNPFAGLSVGVLATVLVQSSSATTATIVGLVGTPGVLTVARAVPMVMGANIGTTVTNTLVSLGHVRQGPEFRRAFAAATVHDFFNLLCVVVFLPLELMTGVLSKPAAWLSAELHGGVSGGNFKSPIKQAVNAGYGVVKDIFEALGFEGTGLAVVILVMGLALTFLCLIMITKTMRTLISGQLEVALNRSLGKSGLIGIGIGALITVAVQSSSITTSLLVPLTAAGVLTLENAFPIMLGANVGTTVTALLASMATEEPEGLTIALVHLFFNVGGIALFYPWPALRRIPLRLATGLAARSQRNPLFLLVYILGVFVALPLGGWALFHLFGSA
jgi:solute carrier family 34 (sodium-dependent phosphate cotransporter)